MNFLWISYEMKLNLFIWNSREVHMNFVWSSNKLLMNFIWNEIKFIHMNLYAVRMKFKWTSYRRTSDVNMLYPCNTNEVDMRFINSSHEIHMKFIWISNDLNFMLTSCELHKNYMTSSLHYTWIWLLASLLCTSYEWASESALIVSISGNHMMTSSNGDIFRVTGHLCGEFTGDRWIPCTKASDVELWCSLLICVWINGWVNNRKAGDLRRYRAHYDVGVMRYLDLACGYSYCCWPWYRLWCGRPARIRLCCIVNIVAADGCFSMRAIGGTKGRCLRMSIIRCSLTHSLTHSLAHSLDLSLSRCVSFSLDLSRSFSLSVSRSLSRSLSISSSRFRPRSRSRLVDSLIFIS